MSDRLSNTLFNLIPKLAAATGDYSFEGLIAKLLEILTGRHFHSAKPGYQAGRDMSSRNSYGNTIFIECKRYRKTRERVEPTISEAIEAGEKIMAVNGGGQTVLEAASNPKLESSDPETNTATTPDLDPWKEEDKPQPTMREILAERGVKGFCKQMPKVSRAEAEAEALAESEAIARSQMNCKTNINQMSLEQINELIKDPIMKAELMPQLFVSDYELITDYLGQIIRVELSEVQIREKRRLEKEQE